MVVGSNLSWQGFKKKAVYTEGAGPVCKCTGQCTLGVYKVGDRDLGVQNFLIGFKIDQSETTKSHMFSTSLRLTNHK